MTDKYSSYHTGVLRSIQFDKQSYEGREHVQLVGRFEILTSADASNDLVGKTETWFGSLSEDATKGKTGKSFYEFTIDGLRACGWTGASLAETPALAESGQLAQEVKLTVEHKLKDDGRGGQAWRTSIAWVNPIGGGKVKLQNELTADELAQFSKRMERLIAGGGKSAAQPPRSAAPPQHRTSHAGNGSAPGRGGFTDDRPPPDDDIPF